MSVSWPRCMPSARSSSLGPDTIAAYLGGRRSIGSGLIVGGEIFRGAGGGAGDFGHLNVDPSGPSCPCGRNGCLQSLIGPQNLLTVGDLMPRDAAARLVDERPEEAIRLIVAAIDEGQSAMLQILKRAGAALGDAIDDVIACCQSAHRDLGRLPGSA